MSTDYVAVITAIDSALLLVGAVQTYTLAKEGKEETKRFVASLDSGMESLRACVRASETPADEELAAALADAPDRKQARSMLWRMVRPSVLSGLWVGMSLALVTSLTQALIWAASKPHGDDPSTALSTLICTVVGCCVVIGEATIRARWATNEGLANIRKWNRDPTNLEVARLLHIYQQRREAASQTSPDPAGSGTSGS
ncbi:hypothetical protein [Streptomyces sp. NPDC102437]|uniref:hypothetical protein n=1 Tax=Streptomyces sp. NPDC102437 TaxID=3366175 RepID=UPI00380CBA6B